MVEPQEFAAKLDVACERNKGNGNISQVFGLSKHFGWMVVPFTKLDDTREMDLCWQGGIKSFVFEHVMSEMKWCWDNKGFYCGRVLLVNVNILSWQTVCNIGPWVAKVSLFHRYFKAVTSYCRAWLGNVLMFISPGKICWKEIGGFPV